MSQKNVNTESRDIWSAESYSQTVAPFVPTLTDTVQAWLDPQPSDAILDVGCGDGTLTAKIAAHAKHVLGVDGSNNMIAAFQQKYPHFSSRVVDCRFLGREKDITNQTFDKVFSNAAMHWILRDPSTRLDVMRACFAALKPGGIMVSESGGLGNVAEVHAALMGELIHRGVTPERAREVSPWWFPSLESMEMLVEASGLKWIKGEIELRQTKLTEVEGGGIKGWVRLFGADFLHELGSGYEREQGIERIVEVLEGVGRRQHDNGFSVNYIRLRFKAQKPN